VQHLVKEWWKISSGKTKIAIENQLPTKPREFHQNGGYSTPWKINMEPKNHPIEKENHLPNHHFQVPC